MVKMCGTNVPSLMLYSICTGSATFASSVIKRLFSHHKIIRTNYICNSSASRLFCIVFFDKYFISLFHFISHDYFSKLAGQSLWIQCKSVLGYGHKVIAKCIKFIDPFSVDFTSRYVASWIVKPLSSGDEPQKQLRKSCFRIWLQLRFNCEL